MSSPTLAEWTAGYGSNATTVTGINTFETGNYIYDKREYTQAASDNEPFTYNPIKVSYAMQLTDGGGQPVGADGVTLADGTADSATSAWWYMGIEVISGKTRILHELNANTLAQIKTLIGTEVNDWTDPA